jgi:predicted phosphoribosyltransferase
MTSVPRFGDRVEAGRLLATALQSHAVRPDAVILGLPRGGIPVAFEISRALSLPLDVLVVRKLGVPGHQELAMGAIASGGLRVLNHDVIRALRIPETTLNEATEREQQELLRREALYRQGRQRPQLAGRTIVLVDDGLATGSTMRAAALSLQQVRPAAILVAVPVAPPMAIHDLRTVADDVVALVSDDRFSAVGSWYSDFTQVDDREVCRLLERAWAAEDVM